MKKKKKRKEKGNSDKHTKMKKKKKIPAQTMLFGTSFGPWQMWWNRVVELVERSIIVGNWMMMMGGSGGS